MRTCSDAPDSERRRRGGGPRAPCRPAPSCWSPRARARGLRSQRPARAAGRVDGPHFLGHARAPRGARPARPAHAADRGAHGPPRADGVPLDRLREDLEGGRAPARVPQGAPRANGARRRSRLLARPGPRERAGRLVRGHVAAGALPLRGRRRDAGSRSSASTTPRCASMDRRRSKDARRTDRMLHSIQIDPRDAAHLYIGMSGRRRRLREHRRGRDWKPLNAGCAANFPAGSRPRVRPRSALRAPAPARARRPLPAEPLRHLSPATVPRALGADRRQHAEGVGDIGFPIVLHPRDPDTAWVFPMDGTDVWPRTSPDGKPAVYVTRDARRELAAARSRLPASRRGSRCGARR